MTRFIGRLLLLLPLLMVLGTGFVPAQENGRPEETPEEVPAEASVPLPVQPAGGIPTRSVLGMLRDGGPVMIPIGVCSFLLTVFSMERFVALRRGRVIPGPWVKRFLAQVKEGQLERDSALELCDENKSPIAKVFAGAVKKWGRPAVEVEQAVLDAGERVANDLRRYLRLFNGISTVTPLLGLLGTVFGMIHSFNTISSSDAMGKSELLASGIGEALLSTAAGLCVAIPALIIYLFFVGRVDRLVMDIDAAGQELVDLISAESRSTSRSSRKEKSAA
jgi:biopolymer transport protein ExbB